MVDKFVFLVQFRVAIFFFLEETAIELSFFLSIFLFKKGFVLTSKASQRLNEKKVKA